MASLSAESKGDSSCESPSTDWTLQMEAYTNWINSQMKKKPSARLVEDLSHDLRDGVTLINLIEIIAEERIDGTFDCPSNQAQMKENVSKILNFMTTNRVKMHSISAKEIVEGNVKSTMRIILALAAHFKPRSVKHSSYRSPDTSVNITSIAQGASAALTSARRDAARAGRRSARRSERMSSQMQNSVESSDQMTESDIWVGASTPMSKRGSLTESQGLASDATPLKAPSQYPFSYISPSNSTLCISTAKQRSRKSVVPRSKSIDLLQDITLDRKWSNIIPRGMFDEVLVECDSLWGDVKDVKRDLFVLQDLLLNGDQIDEQNITDDSVFADSATDQLVLLRSRLHHTEAICTEVKDDLSQARDESLQLLAAKTGLQQRLSDQDSVLLQTKADLLRHSVDLQTIQSERDDLQKLLKEKEKLINSMKSDVAQKDSRIDQLQNNLHGLNDEKNLVTTSLKGQIHELSQRLRAVGETEASLSARVESQDRLMAKLQGKIIQSQQDHFDADASLAQPYELSSNSDELQVITKSLCSLRHPLDPADPVNHTIDTLEQGITTLIEKIHSHGPANKLSRPPYCDGVSRRLTFESVTDDTKVASVCQQSLRHHSDGTSVTRLLYYTDDLNTPSVCTLNKRLSDVRLYDIKKIHNKVGNFRYHFKALDPEFGTVKEEITLDDAPVPGWEGKIVAWIEDDL